MNNIGEFYNSLYSDDSYSGGGEKGVMLKFSFIKNLLDNLNIELSNMTHLDIGAARGGFLKFINAKEKNAIEISQAAKDSMPTDINILDISNIETQDIGKKFDMISALDVIEHLFEPDKTIKNIYNNLNSNGLIVLSVPNDIYHIKNLYKMFFSPYTYSPLQYKNNGHIRFFSNDTLKQLLIDNGFELINISGYGKRTMLNKIFPKLFSYGFIAIGIKK